MSSVEPRDVARLAERAAKQSELHEGMASPAQVMVRPVITVSREYGAQGALIARRVAARLGVPCWDQELVHEVSKNTATPEVVLQDLDEHRRNMVVELLSLVFARSTVTSTEYHRELRRVISAIGQRGGAVVVGRGAQFVLPASSTLKVRVVAPKEARVEALAMRRSMGAKDALALVEDMDETRAAFMRMHYGEDIAAPHHYDLLINSSTFSIEQCVGLIEAAWTARFQDLDARPIASA